MDRTVMLHHHKAIRIKDITKMVTSKRTSSKEAQRRMLNTDMRRKKDKKARSKRVTSTKARRSTSPSKRRQIKLQKPRPNPRPKLKPQPKSKTLLLNEQDIRSTRSENLLNVPLYLSPIH